MHYNGPNSYWLVNGKELLKFKTKYSEIVATLLCLGNISKDWSVDNMKDTGLNRYVDDFGVDCDATAVDDIKNIHLVFDEEKYSSTIPTYEPKSY